MGSGNGYGIVRGPVIYSDSVVSLVEMTMFLSLGKGSVVAMPLTHMPYWKSLLVKPSIYWTRLIIDSSFADLPFQKNHYIRN